jgi:hypothetical protein
MFENKEVFQDTSFLCNQYDNQTAEITIKLPEEYINEDYFYYMICKSPDSSVSQFAVPLALDTDKVNYIVGSNVSWTSGDWEFCLLIKSVAMEDGEVGDDGIVAVSQYFTCTVKSGIINETELEEQPPDPNIVIIYDTMVAAVEAETQRIAAEAERVSNEEERVAAENERVTAENERVTAENERIANENERIEAETAREEAEEARSLCEPYNSSNDYVPGNKVTYLGSTYQNIVACTNVLPTVTDNWILIAAKGTDGTGTGDMSKTDYDSNEDGVVNDSDKLGGNLPEYYATSADVEAIGEQIENLESQVSTIETQTILENYNPIQSIPSTAKRGKLDVNLKGMTLVNSVIDGINSFGYYNSTFSITNGIASNIGNGDTEKPYFLLDMFTEDKWFIYVLCRVTNDECTSIDIGNSNSNEGYLSVSNPEEDKWYELYGFQTNCSSDNFYIFHRYADSATANGKELQIDDDAGVFAINMTALGIEDLTEEEMLRLVRNGYFEGMKSTTGITVRSENSSGTEISSITYTTVDGEPITLNRLPNGTYDEITEDGKLIKRVREYELQESDVTSLSNFTNNQLIDINIEGTSFGKTTGEAILEGYIETISANYDTVGFDKCFYNTSTGGTNSTYGRLRIIRNLGTYTTLAEAQADLAGTKILYELYEPEIIDTNATPLVAEPSGTVYIYVENCPQPSVELSYPSNLGAVVDGLIEGQKELSEFAQNQNAINIEFDLRITALEG